MQKRILVPTDFSKPAWNALVYGLNLFRNTECHFYILNVFKTELFSGDNAPSLNYKAAFKNAKSEADKGLKKVLQGLQFRKENPKHSFEGISSAEELTDAVQEIVNKKGIDLIILGAAGEIAAINSAYDNSLSKLINKTENCPLLVIPESHNLQRESFTEIVFPTNFRYGFKIKELDPVRLLAELIQTPIRILYVSEDGKPLNKTQEENKKALKEYLSGQMHSFHTLTQTTSATGIHLFIESRDSSLLALYKRKQGFFSRLFAHSFVQDIDFSPKVPVLILKEME